MSKILLSFIISLSIVSAQPAPGPEKQVILLDSTAGLELVNVKADVVEHDGRTGIQVSKADGEINGETLVIIPGIDFKDFDDTAVKVTVCCEENAQ